VYMGLYNLRYKYHISLKVLKRILHCLDYRERKAKNRTYIEVNTRMLEKYCRLWKLGTYQKEVPRDIASEEYITLSQAEAISGIPVENLRKAIARGKIKTIKNPAGRRLIEVESLREWARNRRLTRISKKESLNYSWIYPPTQKRVRLLKEFFHRIAQVKEYAEKKGIPLEKDWITKVIDFIHKRERQKERGRS